MRRYPRALVRLVLVRLDGADWSPRTRFVVDRDNPERRSLQ
jgi:hypothetical protein